MYRDLEDLHVRVPGFKLKPHTPALGWGRGGVREDVDGLIQVVGGGAGCDDARQLVDGPYLKVISPKEVCQRLGAACQDNNQYALASVLKAASPSFFFFGDGMLWDCSEPDNPESPPLHVARDCLLPCESRGPGANLRCCHPTLNHLGISNRSCACTGLEGSADSWDLRL